MSGIREYFDRKRRVESTWGPGKEWDLNGVEWNGNLVYLTGKGYMISLVYESVHSEPIDDKNMTLELMKLLGVKAAHPEMMTKDVPDIARGNKWAVPINVDPKKLKAYVQQKKKQQGVTLFDVSKWKVGEWGWDLDTWGSLTFEMRKKEMVFKGYDEAKAANGEVKFKLVGGEISIEEISAGLDRMGGPGGVSPWVYVVQYLKESGMKQDAVFKFLGRHWSEEDECGSWKSVVHMAGSSKKDPEFFGGKFEIPKNPKEAVKVIDKKGKNFGCKVLGIKDWSNFIK